MPWGRSRPDKHADLVRQVQALQEKFASGNQHININIKVMSFLKSWITGHIQNSDKDYTPYLYGRQRQHG